MLEIALPVAAAGLAVAATRYGFGGPSRLFGRSRFAGRLDGMRAGLKYSVLPRTDCLILGRTRGFLGLGSRFVGLPGPEHVMIYATSGAGKGVSYVIPNCLNYEDSLVVLDIKRENFDATAGHRKQRLGQDVFLFSPLAEDGRTHCWNPLGGISTASQDYISKLQSRAFSVFPPVDEKVKFWQDGARNAFHGVAVMLAETPGAEVTIGAIFALFSRGDVNDVLVERLEERRAAGTPHSQPCVNLISDYLTGSEEVVQGKRSHLTATLGLWFNPAVCAATARSDFDLHDLRRRKMTIYIGVMPADLEQLGVLLRLFFLQLYEANVDKRKEQDPTVLHRCHVLMDEFTAIPPMKAFAKAAGYARGFGLHFSYIVQSKMQVREDYKGMGASTLFGVLGAELAFSVNDPDLCKEVSERSGTDTVTATTRTAPRWFSFFRQKEQAESERDHARPLLLPQEVARLPAGQEIAFRGMAPPFKLRRLSWWQDRLFKDLRLPAPEVPTVAFSIARDDGSVRLQAPRSRQHQPAGE